MRKRVNVQQSYRLIPKFYDVNYEAREIGGNFGVEPEGKDGV